MRISFACILFATLTQVRAQGAIEDAHSRSLASATKKPTRKPTKKKPLTKTKSPVTVTTAGPYFTKKPTKKPTIAPKV